MISVPLISMVAQAWHYMLRYQRRHKFVGSLLMAQVFVPENPRERDQLQQGRTGVDHREIPPGRLRGPRRFGLIDLVVFLAVVAAISFIVLAASRWTAPLTPAVKIDLSPGVLPLYAGYSLLRMLLGYVLSL